MSPDEKFIAILRKIGHKRAKEKRREGKIGIMKRLRKLKLTIIIMSRRLVFILKWKMRVIFPLW